MKCLLDYLNGLPVSEQAEFAKRCGTSVGYMRKAVSVGQRLNLEVCIKLERESAAAITCESLRPDVDWAYLRSGAAVPQQCAGATESEAAPQAQEVANA